MGNAPKQITQWEILKKLGTMLDCKIGLHIGWGCTIVPLPFLMRAKCCSPKEEYCNLQKLLLCSNSLSSMSFKSISAPTLLYWASCLMLRFFRHFSYILCCISISDSRASCSWLHGLGDSGGTFVNNGKFGISPRTVVSTSAFMKLNVESCQHSSSPNYCAFSISSINCVSINSINIRVVLTWSKSRCFSFCAYSTCNFDASNFMDVSCYICMTFPTNFGFHSLQCCDSSTTQKVSTNSDFVTTTSDFVAFDVDSPPRWDSHFASFNPFKSFCWASSFYILLKNLER